MSFASVAWSSKDLETPGRAHQFASVISGVMMKCPLRTAVCVWRGSSEHTCYLISLILLRMLFLLLSFCPVSNWRFKLSCATH